MWRSPPALFPLPATAIIIVAMLIDRPTS